MNIYYLNYKFNKTSLDLLDDKYKEKISNDYNLLFLYSNTFEFTKFYTLYHPFHKFRSVYDMFQENPKEFFKNLIIYTKKNSYNKYDITLLYSLANYYILLSKEDYKKLSQFTDFTNFKKDLNQVSYYIYFARAHQYNAYALDTLKSVVSETYHIYNFDKIESLSLNEFYHFYNKNFFTLSRYHLLKPFSKNYRRLKIKDKLDKKDIDFSMELFESKKFINAINNYLFLNKDIEFNNYFEKKED